MTQPAVNAAVLWTGGKDSVLALHEARQSGWHISRLVTFAPPQPQFLAHPLEFMRLQAEALGLEHVLWTVNEPYAESYEAGLRWLQTTHKIDTVITGDIAEVGGSPNWIRERSRPMGMNVLTPLWGRDRLTLLQQLLAGGYKVLFSCVKTRWLDASWVGRELNDEAITSLRALRELNGLDLCGEEGEYHTLVTDAPGFQRCIQLDATHIREQADLAYLEMTSLKLQDKP